MKFAVITWSCYILLFIAFWIFYSHFEAKTFTKLTGKPVTTVQAMFVQLRIQEPHISENK